METDQKAPSNKTNNIVGAIFLTAVVGMFVYVLHRVSITQ